MYNNNGYGTYEISLQKDSLFALMGSHVFWLRHYHYDWFELFEKDPQTGIDTSGESFAKMEFTTSETGDIESAASSLEPLLKPIVFTRSSKMQQQNAADLKNTPGNIVLAALLLKYIRRVILFYFYS